MLSTLTLFVVLGGCSANIGLRDSGSQAQGKPMTTATVTKTLFAELHDSGRGPGAAHLDAIQELLGPMYAALPKSGEHAGGLDDNVVRYALHRFLEQQYGWNLKGLGLREASVNTSVPAIIQASRTPSFIVALVEEGLQGRGVNLRELAVLAAMLQDLVHSENNERLLEAYRINKIPPETPDEAMTTVVHETYMALMSSRVTVAKLQKLPRHVHMSLPWFFDARHTLEWKAHEKINPFVRAESSRAKSERLADEIVQQMAQIQDMTCHSMKADLLDSEEAPGSGRVRLNPFYRTKPSGFWKFAEPLDYLREQNLVDESDPNNPKVVISNYVYARSNCLQPGPSQFFSFCCVDQCVPLLRRLEEHAAAPTMEPQRVLQLVASLPTETVAAPRNLSSDLSNRLEQIAARHGGAVPLHSRLFAQWMHHAFPNECSNPYDAGSPYLRTGIEDWIAEVPDRAKVNVTALSHEAGADRLESAAFDEGRVEDFRSAVLPWTEDEELLAMDSKMTPAPSTRLLGSALRVLAFAAAAASGLANLRRVFEEALPALPTHSRSRGNWRRGGKIV